MKSIFNLKAIYSFILNIVFNGNVFLEIVYHLTIRDTSFLWAYAFKASITCHASKRKCVSLAIFIIAAAFCPVIEGVRDIKWALLTRCSCYVHFVEKKLNYQIILECID